MPVPEMLGVGGGRGGRLKGKPVNGTNDPSGGSLLFFPSSRDGEREGRNALPTCPTPFTNGNPYSLEIAASFTTNVVAKKDVWCLSLPSTSR